jgi:L-cysteine desulfidase
MNHEDNSYAVTVFESGHEGLIALAKSMLDEANIEYVVKGEGVENLLGVGVMGTGYNPITGAVQIQVLENNAEQARLLLKDLKESDV